MADFVRALLTLHLPRVRAAAPDALWFVGLALIAYGIGTVYRPAGFIAAGIGLCFIGFVFADDKSDS